jgi:diadenylate cyclase
MAKQDIGALIIITPSTVDAHILDSGTFLNANLSAPLLESIFNTKAPLHDGAVIVKGNKIISAGCFLPLTQDITLPKELGTRHRAAIGITEESNVMAIVVSEESGIISLARQANL